MKLIIHEIKKIKRSAILGIATFLPLIAVLQGAVERYSREGLSQWDSMFINGMILYSWLIFPILITVVMAMLTRLEHANNGWKQILALPISRGNLFLTKAFIGAIVILYSIVILMLGFIMVALIKDISIPYQLIATRMLLIYVSALPIMTILFYVGFTFSHVGVPLAIGAGLALPSMIVANSETYWIMFPWTYPIITSLSSMFSEMVANLPLMYTISTIGSAVVLLAGYVQFRSKDIV
ncbi:hypothetical protein EJF36_07860 [Bacillus sp. HMF5848]|uniref:ABC transporter permease n=1 Tax=Bacillus sp. HMF5848 TaxID=2495421 RepID=UPI000F790EAE|nr:ABC transporter permease [Bacillus sp. HMF5848]RSK26784.1 hypothetical protein EJF36_07860 [Bacillus sp. HMF5848]